jgi:hypothetical protein
METYADLQKKYVATPPVAIFPLKKGRSAIALSDPMYANEP